MPDDAVDEPGELAEVRHVTVWARSPTAWNLEIDYPDTMSPYEAYGMLFKAAGMAKDDLDAQNATEESTES